MISVSTWMPNRPSFPIVSAILTDSLWLEPDRHLLSCALLEQLWRHPMGAREPASNRWQLLDHWVSWSTVVQEAS
jgi:hypothetical protein